MDSNQGTQRERIYSPPQLPLCHIPICCFQAPEEAFVPSRRWKYYVVRKNLVNVYPVAGRILPTICPHSQVRWGKSVRNLRDSTNSRKKNGSRCCTGAKKVSGASSGNRTHNRRITRPVRYRCAMLASSESIAASAQEASRASPFVQGAGDSRGSCGVVGALRTLGRTRG